MSNGANSPKPIRFTVRKKFPSCANLSGPDIWWKTSPGRPDGRRGNSSKLCAGIYNASFEASRLQFAFYTRKHDLLRTRRSFRLPVNGAGDGFAHSGKPPLSTRHACFIAPAKNMCWRSIKTEFELLVGCHNFV